jgi:hypothetical protein
MREVIPCLAAHSAPPASTASRRGRWIRGPPASPWASASPGARTRCWPAPAGRTAVASAPGGSATPRRSPRWWPCGKRWPRAARGPWPWSPRGPTGTPGVRPGAMPGGGGSASAPRRRTPPPRALTACPPRTTARLRPWWPRWRPWAKRRRGPTVHPASGSRRWRTGWTGSRRTAGSGSGGWGGSRPGSRGTGRRRRRCWSCPPPPGCGCWPGTEARWTGPLRPRRWPRSPRGAARARRREGPTAGPHRGGTRRRPPGRGGEGPPPGLRGGSPAGPPCGRPQPGPAAPPPPGPPGPGGAGPRRRGRDGLRAGGRRRGPAGLPLRARVAAGPGTERGGASSGHWSGAGAQQPAGLGPGAAGAGLRGVAAGAQARGQGVVPGPPSTRRRFRPRGAGGRAAQPGPGAGPRRRPRRRGCTREGGAGWRGEGPEPGGGAAVKGCGWNFTPGRAGHRPHAPWRPPGRAPKSVAGPGPHHAAASPVRPMRRSRRACHAPGDRWEVPEWCGRRSGRGEGGVQAASDGVRGPTAAFRGSATENRKAFGRVVPRQDRHSQDLC